MYYTNHKKILKIQSKIEESINKRKSLTFTYIKWKEHYPEERKVLFQEMYTKNDRFYAVGYCLKRRSNRTFRLDRIQEIKGIEYSIEKTPQYIGKPEKPAVSTPITQKIAEIHEQQRVHRSDISRGILIAFLVTSIAGGIIFMYIVVNTPRMWEKVFGEKDDYYVTPTSIIYTEIKGRNINYKRSEINLDKEYRGYLIEQKDSHFMIKGLEGEYDSLFDMIIKINSMVFMEATGIDDENLLYIYFDADLNKNGLLSWEEIKTFQMKINREYNYISNDTALRPDEFVKEGGGDCEDWALFTAGLLRFWNYEPYIGSLEFKDNFHAVTLVKVDELPYKFNGYYIEKAKLADEKQLTEGLYTFLDYYRVGKVTKAAGRKPRLVRVSDPEWCYGRAM